MPKVTTTFQHKGWFGLCPVYFSNLHSEAPRIDPRHWLLTPLMIASEWIFAAIFAVRSALDPLFVPEWPLKVTGELSPPLQRVHEVREEAP